jgi:hypothetical protein
MMSAQSETTKTLYEQDFYQWLETTAKLLKARHFEALDLENLIEEIESMGRSEKRELENRLIAIIEHLLKLLYWYSETEYNASGWRGTVIEQRRQVERLLKDSPSLKFFVGEIFLECYEIARKDILKKYELPPEMFPLHPPFGLTEALNPDYLPTSDDPAC